MGSLGWLADNWFHILNAVGIIGGLLFTGYSLHSETKTRRIANLLLLTQGHRDIWKQVLTHPHLSRILDPNTALSGEPASREEEIFVSLIIQHLSVVFHATRDKLTIQSERLRRDVGWFFSLPIPRTIWEHAQVFQNDEFVAFVEECRVRK